MKQKIRVEGNYEDPKVQKAMLVNLFSQIQKDLFASQMMKLQLAGAIDIYAELKSYVMDLYDKVCPECKAPFTKSFYEKTFDIWWDFGLEEALRRNYWIRFIFIK